MKSLYLVTLIAALPLAGCGGADDKPAAAPADGPAAAAAAAPAEAAAAAPAPQARPKPAAPPSAEGGQTEPTAPPAVQRTRRLDTFDEEAVFWAMYHYAGVTPPLRQWAEESWMPTPGQSRPMTPKPWWKAMWTGTGAATHGRF